MQEKLADFYIYLLNKNEENLLSLFSGVPMIDTPFEGKIIGREAFLNFVACQQTWLREHKTEPEIFSLTATEQRICAEFVLYLEYENRNIDLPVGIVADRSDGKVYAIRVYHSTWPFTGKHMIRPPLLKPVKNLDEPEVIKRYTAVLRKGDANAVLKLFEDKGYVREPSGSKYKHSGRNGQNEFYIPALEAGGFLLNTVQLPLKALALLWSIFVMDGEIWSLNLKLGWQYMNWELPGFYTLPGSTMMSHLQMEINEDLNFKFFNVSRNPS